MHDLPYTYYFCKGGLIFAIGYGWVKELGLIFEDSSVRVIENEVVYDTFFENLILLKSEAELRNDKRRFI